MKYAQKTSAVSPIVATLVLIVVAVVGAVAVGTIMGTFSNSVAKQADAGEAASASQTTILVAGSTTIQPVTDALAKVYMTSNPGIKIVSNGGGSGAGLFTVMNNVADIGAMSEDMSTAQKLKFPNAVQWRIGSGGIAIITNAKVPATAAAALSNVTDLRPTFDADAATPAAANNITDGAVVVFRSDSSGTKDSFYAAMGLSVADPVANTLAGSTTTVSGQSGNAALVSKVASTDKAIGYCDYGYVAGRTDVKILGIIMDKTQGGSTVDSRTYTATWDNIQAAAKNLYAGASQGANYPQGMTHPLYYITNGQPSAIAKDFITYAQSLGAKDVFKSVNTVGMGDIYGL